MRHTCSFCGGEARRLPVSEEHNSSVASYLSVYCDACRISKHTMRERKKFIRCKCGSFAYYCDDSAYWNLIAMMNSNPKPKVEEPVWTCRKCGREYTDPWYSIHNKRVPDGCLPVVKETSHKK